MQTPSPETNQKLWHSKPIAQVLAELKTDPIKGLDDAQVKERLNRYGTNELIEQGRKELALILLEQFTSLLVIILIIAAIISGFLGKPTETIAILAIVFLFAILSFIQEYRAEKSMAALRKLTVPLVRVWRNGNLSEFSARNLVPGDILVLEAGNLVPADVRLIQSVNLRIQEAALTGESEPVDKDSAVLDKSDLPLGDRRNMGYMGTVVTYGHGTAVVVETGMRTELGKIATLIQGVKQEMTPLQRRMNQVGTTMAIFGVSVAFLIMIIGLLLGETIKDMFLTAVSLAVAVVPEGLPAVVTVTLALGAQRMLKRNSLIRKLPAVETLGSVTVICSDKTGTLTENQMTVTVIDVAGRSVELLEMGDRSNSSDDQKQICHRVSLAEQPPTVCMVMIGGALCNDATLRPDSPNGQFRTIGDPTEGALLVAASHANISKTELQEKLPRVAELPFDSSRKRMTTVHELPSSLDQLPQPIKELIPGDYSYLSITKGGVDGLLEISSQVYFDDHIEILDECWYQRIQSAHDQMAEKGMRILGVALKWLHEIPDPSELDHLEQGLILVGLIGMMDPPRPEVREAVQTCQQAGIRPVMITGDHPLTAQFIANELGISTSGTVVTGQQLNRMSDAELEGLVNEISVFARVTPEHKLRIVQALQNQGEIVAMTGDGVNDSPALKKADIGVAMGITGTDVSKESADMVLLDDNFSTIVAAVEEGRVIYDNIRRFVKFSLAGNIGKVLVMLFAPLLGITLALLPLQLLWLNLLTDGLLGLGLGLEPAEKNTMRRPPRNPKEHFFSKGLWSHILWVGLVIGGIALVVGSFYHDPRNAHDNTWQTMIFTILAFLQVGQALASRSMPKTTISLDFRSNPIMWLMVLAVITLQLAVLYTPMLRQFFNVTPLSGKNLLICLASASLVYLPIKLEKIFKKDQPI